MFELTEKQEYDMNHYVVLDKGSIVESRGVTIFDLNLLQQEVVEEDDIKKGKALLADLIEVNMYGHAEQVMAWLKEIDSADAEARYASVLRDVPPTPTMTIPPKEEPTPPQLKQPEQVPANRRFSDESVRKIRKEAKSPKGKSYQEMADEAGVSYATIYAIATGKSYKDVK
jgi:hypothetical protein